ncbi:MAG: FAD-dependent oxidoreductase [bacterium]
MKTHQKKRKISRRSFLKSGAALTSVGVFETGVILERLAAAPLVEPERRANQPHVAVVGAGAFGGWTALYLLRLGARVTLLDAWGAGNSRSSSGGETRVIRAIYGPDEIYVKLVARAVQLWRENEKRWNRTLYRRTGALWMFQHDDSFVTASRPFLTKEGFKLEDLSGQEAHKRFAQVNFDGVKRVLYEKEAGYLTARHACNVVRQGFLEEGGEYRQLAVRPGAMTGGELQNIQLSDGSTFSADHYVFACGAWLAKVFPKLLGHIIKPTRQTVLYFGTPAGDRRFVEDDLPVWVDLGQRIFYGIPGDGRRGFKIADDTRGEPIDPTLDDRKPSHEGFETARSYIEFRFPDLKGAPLLEARACVYENAPDHHFILDHHPEAHNLWLIGGGSGHGFKHGPAVGEMVAEMVLGQKSPEPFFSLSRFAP